MTLVKGGHITAPNFQGTRIAIIQYGLDMERHRNTWSTALVTICHVLNHTPTSGRGGNQYYICGGQFVNISRALEKGVFHLIQWSWFQEIIEQIYEDVYLIINSSNICLLAILTVSGADMVHTFKELLGQDRRERVAEIIKMELVKSYCGGRYGSMKVYGKNFSDLFSSCLIPFSCAQFALQLPSTGFFLYVFISERVLQMC